MNIRKISILLFVLTLCVGGFLARNSWPSSYRGWHTYINTTYGYQFSYPKDLTVDYVLGTANLPVEQSDDVVVFTQGKPPAFGVTAYIPLTGWGYLLEKKQTELIALPLRQFAEAVRTIQINDKNPYAQNKQTGELKEITFAGQHAYSFTQTMGFNGPHGNYSFEPANATYNFIFIENKAGVKLMIRYRIGDAAAEKIKESFVFAQ